MAIAPDCLILKVITNLNFKIRVHHTDSRTIFVHERAQDPVVFLTAYCKSMDELRIGLSKYCSTCLVAQDIAG